MDTQDRIKIAIQVLIGYKIADNQEGIGKLLGYNNKSSFSQVVNGKVPLPNDFLEKLANLDDRISKNWLINNTGSITLSKQVYINSESNLYDESIPLISIETMDSGNTLVRNNVVQRFVVPIFKGANYLIWVIGDSMYPNFNSGDIVACKYLSLDTFFQWNKVYLLDTIQGVLIKRIGKGSDDNHLMMISDNEKYEPFELDKKDIHSVSIVLGSIKLY